MRAASVAVGVVATFIIAPLFLAAAAWGSHMLGQYLDEKWAQR